MALNAISVPVTVTAHEFCMFSLFNVFIYNKRWKMPVAFALIMGFFSAVCFALQTRAEQAALLGAVLLIIGFGLPLAYLSNFLSLINRQCKRLPLDGKHVMYTLDLMPEGLNVHNKKQRTFFPWKDVRKIYIRRKCAYIYASENRSYIIPYHLTDEKEVKNALTKAASLIEKTAA